MKTESYKDRVLIHDQLGLPAIDYLFGLMGYSHFSVGIEREAKRFRDALKSRDDPLALKFRFHPDRLYVHDEQISIACEIKTEFKHRQNFAIEFDSYLQSTKFNEMNYLYAFVCVDNFYDYLICDVLLSIADNIPAPTEFIVPKQHRYYRQFIERIQKEFPGSILSFREKVTGSGTPFFLIPKISDFLIEPHVFFLSSMAELRWPILFDKNHARIDLSEQIYTHRYHGGKFFLAGRNHAWRQNIVKHLDNPPMITHLLTLDSERMGHNRIWTFTDIQFNELMRKD